MGSEMCIRDSNHGDRTRRRAGTTAGRPVDDEVEPAHGAAVSIARLERVAVGAALDDDGKRRVAQQRCRVAGHRSGYSDDDTSTYDLTESGNVVQTASGADCVTTCDSSTLDTEVWGNQWWNDPYVSQSYINFKVTRYEMADAFGVEFYSTEGDTLKVFSTGDVHFKPDNAERTVYINEQVEYEYETDIDRRLSTAEAVLGDIDLTLPIDHARLVEARYRHSNTRGGSQKPAAASEVPSPKGDPVALKERERVVMARRLAFRRGMPISSAGSFSFGQGSKRAGND